MADDGDGTHATAPGTRRKTHLREFQLKRIFVNSALWGAFILTAVATTAEAQNGTWRATSTGNRPRQAVERRPAPQQVIVVQPQYNPYYPVYPVAYTTIPAIIMSDGSIWADLGYGNYPVSRACVLASSVATAPTVVAGNGFVLSGGAPTYMQPAPAQLTPSQQNLPSAQQAAALAAQNACYSRDAYGRAFVIR